MALSLLDRQHTVAGPGFNRWLIPPAALAVAYGIYQTVVQATDLIG